MAIETVIKLTPSWVAASAGEVVMLKRMLLASSQRRNARRAAPVTSLPALMFGGGALSELERATVIVVAGHLIWALAVELVYCTA